MPTKTCLICGVSKSLNEFAHDPSLRPDGKPTRRDGYHPYCKKCVREKRRKDYEKNPNRFKNTNKRWSERNKEKSNIYSKIQWARKVGILHKPNRCELCGKEPDNIRKIVAHHPNGYDKKHVFDVQWLCISCHRRIHTNYPIIKNQNVV